MLQEDSKSSKFGVEYSLYQKLACFNDINFTSQLTSYLAGIIIYRPVKLHPVQFTA